MRRLITFVVILNAFLLFALMAAATATAQTSAPFTVGGLLDAFWTDGKVKILVILIFLDFTLGVISALKLGTFRLSYVADFARKDVVFKLGAYLFVYAGALYAGQTDIIIDGLDLGVIAGGLYVVIVAAFAGSIFNSLREIGYEKGPEERPSVIAMATADESV